MTRLTRAGLFDRSRLGNINPQNSQSLARFQDTLSHGKALLAEYHLEGGNAATLGKHQSWLIDQLLVSAWTAFTTDTTIRNVPSLIAAGGYGRQELNLESDIDLLVLLPAAPGKAESELIENFVRFCWDMGLKVGHSARSLKQCIDIAAKDLTVITNLMETRLVHGDPGLFDRFQEKLRARSLWPADRYFKAKLAEQQARHLHYGDTAYTISSPISRKVRVACAICT